MNRRTQKNSVDLIPPSDIWDFIHQNCPLSRLEAEVLLYRYIYGIGEKELAAKLGVSWRRINRATYRMKAKIRLHKSNIRLLEATLKN